MDVCFCWCEDDEVRGSQSPSLVDLVGESIRLIIEFDDLMIPSDGIISTDNLPR
jgi:hypothetical protein